MPDPDAFSLAIRWLHVVAMATALGGAVLLAASPRSRTISDERLAFAAVYERAFWVAVGVLVMSGIGNVAAFGASLPGTGASWGAAFQLKLLAVLLLVALSVPRTVAVAQLAGAGTNERASGRLAALYGTTAAALLAILAVAVWLAHG